MQDAVFKAKQVVWTSSVQGELGRGATISAALQPGSHAITVSAENSAGKTGKAAVRVEVAAVPPTIDAVLIP